MLKFDDMNCTALSVLLLHFFYFHKPFLCFLCSEIAKCSSISQKLSLSKRRKVKYTYQATFLHTFSDFIVRALVRNLKQRVPITSKPAKFNGATQHYVFSKVAKISGCQTSLSKNSMGARHPWHPC